MTIKLYIKSADLLPTDIEFQYLSTNNIIYTENGIYKIIKDTLVLDDCEYETLIKNNAINLPYITIVSYDKPTTNKTITMIPYKHYISEKDHYTFVINTDVTLHKICENESEPYYYFTFRYLNHISDYNTMNETMKNNILNEINSFLVK